MERGHNKVTFGHDIILLLNWGGGISGKGIQTMSIEQGIFWYKMFFAVAVFFFFCCCFFRFRCEGDFVHGEKSDVSKHSTNYRILFNVPMLA